MSLKSLVVRTAAGVSASFAAAGAALATEPSTFDVTGAVATLGEVEGGLVLIGGVLVGLAAVAVGFNWIKGMIFG